MKYAYFPGCSAESTARDLYLSTLAVAPVLGIEFVEPKGWSCCGTTMAHQVDHDLSVSLAAANLLKVKDMGLDMVVSCASCYSRMKIANPIPIVNGPSPAIQNNGSPARTSIHSMTVPKTMTAIAM